MVKYKKLFKNAMYMRAIPLIKFYLRKKKHTHIITCLTLFMHAFCHMHVENLLLIALLLLLLLLLLYPFRH